MKDFVAVMSYQSQTWWHQPGVYCLYWSILIFLVKDTFSFQLGVRCNSITDYARNGQENWTTGPLHSYLARAIRSLWKRALLPRMIKPRRKDRFVVSIYFLLSAKHLDNDFCVVCAQTFREGDSTRDNSRRHRYERGTMGPAVRKYLPQ